MKKNLKINKLSISFNVGDKEFKATQNVGFDLYENEILGIVGESGSGKSVTALSILGLTNGKYTKTSSIQFENKELIGAPNHLMRQIRGSKIGFVFQEPMSSLNPLHQVGKQIMETILLHQFCTKDEAKVQVIELMTKVGLKVPEKRYYAYPYELSGGERQRVMIAMAIANRPDILILDEPTTALDVTIERQIINLILELKREFGMSVIFISHDLHLVSKIADRIIVMYRGQIVEEGKTKDVFRSPQHEYTKTLISSSNILKKNKKTNKNKALKIQNLDVRYPIKTNIFGKVLDEIVALNQVSLEVYEGETLGLVGESGSGKTTLGQCIVDLIKYKGSIDYNLKFSNSQDFRKRVQIIFQDPYNSLNPRMNVLDIVGEGLKVHLKDLTPSEIEQRVLDMLMQVGLKKESLHKYPHEFSGGERQRIAIARAMILQPKLVVLDEPTSALDVTIQKQILHLLKDFQKKFNITYVFISHDMRAVTAMSDRIAVMKNGKIVEINDADCILKNPKSSYTKSLIEAALM